MIRAKFYATQITHFANNGGRRIELRPVYSNDPNHENKAFWQATPSGMIEMHISNPDVVFEVGKEYYVDFTLAEVKQ